MWKKTGVFYEFSGKAGAMLGLNSMDVDHHLVKALSSFTGNCGIAFQLQDDILGIIGDEDILGKPVGSDIREGKRTLILCHAYKNADDKQRNDIINIFGNRYVNDADIKYAKKLLIDLDGIEYAKQMARSYVEKSMVHLDRLPESKYRDLLSMWAEYMIEREF